LVDIGKIEKQINIYDTIVNKFLVKNEEVLNVVYREVNKKTAGVYHYF